MITKYITIGNTVELTVSFENTEHTLTNSMLAMYKTKSFSEGLTDLVLQVEPTDSNDGQLTFLFDTESIVTTQNTLFVHVSTIDGTKKRNLYLKLKFVYENVED